MQYDRKALRAAAKAAGQQNSRQMALHLGISEMAGWRLWHGKAAPSARTAALVEFAYGLPAAALLKPATAHTATTTTEVTA
ncbi:hypothetical protein [Streptomyces sp. NPDC002644]